MPIRTSRTAAPSVLRRVTGLVLIACALTVHISVHASDMPERGMTRSAVERAFGAPEQKRAPVGQPPISRWVYADFTVYFEGDYTLHAVSHRPPPAPARTPDMVSGPAPAAVPETEASSAENRAEYRFDPATGQIIPLGDATTPAPQVAPASAVSAPAGTAPAAQEPAPATEPVPVNAEPPAATHPDTPPEPDDGKRPARFRFDPASGRIIMDDGQPPATANPGGTDAPAAEPEQEVPESTPDTAPEPETTPAESEGGPATDTGGGFRMQW